MKAPLKDSMPCRTELVLASDETARLAHKELYHLHDDLYRIVEDDLLGVIAALEGEMKRLHMSLNWDDILKLATWRASPSMGDVFFLLKNAGIGAEELLPFRNSDVTDLFPWLYYGKRLDVLRKVCRVAKANAEKRIKNRDTRVYCHLSLVDTNRIVASSL